MAYPTGFEQLLDAVRSWEAPYFKQQQLGQQKAQMKGQLALDLARLDLANKQAIVNDAYKRAQMKTLGVQDKLAMAQLEKTQKELAHLDEKFKEEKELNDAQIYAIKKQADAAMQRAYNKGAISAKDKKISQFTSDMFTISEKLMGIIDDKSLRKPEDKWNEFAKVWSEARFPMDALQQIKPYFNAIASAPYDSPYRQQLQNFITNNIFTPVLTSHGLTEKDISNEIRLEFLKPYNFSGIQIAPEVTPEPTPGKGIIPRTVNKVEEIFGKKISQKPTTPTRQEAPIPPKSESPTGQVGILGVLPQGMGNNVYGNGNMLANKPAPASVGTTGNQPPIQQANTGIESLKPSSLQQNQWDQVVYNGKLYLVNPATNEVRDAQTNQDVGFLHGKWRILKQYRENKAKVGSNY